MGKPSPDRTAPSGQGKSIWAWWSPLKRLQRFPNFYCGDVEVSVSVLSEGRLSLQTRTFTVTQLFTGAGKLVGNPTCRGDSTGHPAGASEMLPATHRQRGTSVCGGSFLSSLTWCLYFLFFCLLDQPGFVSVTVCHSKATSEPVLASIDQVYAFS